MRRRKPLLLTLAAMALVAAGTGQTAEEEKKIIARGRAEYIEMGCYQCHGYQGQAGPGGRIAPTRLSYEAFAFLVRRPVRVMPAYSPRVLSDEKLERIYRYVKSIPEPPDPSSLPLLAEPSESREPRGRP